MSISDRAFIRAYHEDPAHTGRGSIAAIDIGLGSVIPPPHAKFPPTDAPASKEPIAPNQTIAQGEPEAAAPGILSNLPAARIGMTKPHIPLGQSPKAALSAFTSLGAATIPAANSPKPALEIDSVRWPAMCEALLAKSGEGFDRLAADLRAEAAAGHKVTAITGTNRSEGRTTLSLCLARCLAAEAHSRIILVDADFGSPQMASQFGIALERGWEAVLAGDEPLWEMLIESVADRFALALLGSGVSAGATHKSSTATNSAVINSAATSDAIQHRIVPEAFRVAAVLGELAEHFDMVLIDAGPLMPESVTGQWLLEPSVGVHNIILAHDVRRPEARRLAAGCLRIAEAKQRQLGIAETFVSGI
ncbi:MAG TPA: hypothetical protein VFE46_10355 [Pirellulales bacterium]|jgi:Mrp family chromosome partitioning ATPase|nr:hypothetical protein [Pirellulales bacterium]